MVSTNRRGADDHDNGGNHPWYINNMDDPLEYDIDEVDDAMLCSPWVNPDRGGNFYA